MGTSGCHFRIYLWKTSVQKASQVLGCPTLLFLSQLNASLSHRQREACLASPLSSGHLLYLGFEMSVLLTTEVKLGFDLSFILQWLVSVCGRNWTRASKHQSDSQLIFFLRTRRTIRSSNLIISGGLVRA